MAPPAARTEAAAAAVPLEFNLSPSKSCNCHRAPRRAADFHYERPSRKRFISAINSGGAPEKRERGVEVCISGAKSTANCTALSSAPFSLCRVAGRLDGQSWTRGLEKPRMEKTVDLSRGNKTLSPVPRGIDCLNPER